MHNAPSVCDDATMPLHQSGCHTLADSPTNHPAGIKLKHHRQIQPAFFRPNIGDVRHPLWVRHIRRKILLQQVGRNRQGAVAVGCGFIFLGRFRTQTIVPHQQPLQTFIFATAGNRRQIGTNVSEWHPGFRAAHAEKLKKVASLPPVLQTLYLQ